MATIYEVSERAGVSLATVSRVINGTAKVSERTRDRVLSVMKELNYRPNAAAKSLASNRYDTVGLLVSELHGPFFGEMMSGVEDVLSQAGKHVIVAAGHSDAASEKEAIEYLRGHSCDALILHADAVSDRYLLKLAQDNFPFVLINRYIDAIASQCISLDNQKGGYLATKALLEMGHTSIAYISGPAQKTDAQERLAGHKQAMKEYRCKLDPELIIEGDFRMMSGEQAVSQLFEAGKSFTAIACGNDEMACGAMNAVREQGLQIPQDISVVGFDNVIMSRYTFPHLSTIDYPVEAMGKMAANWVLKHVYERLSQPLQFQFEPHLLMRDSIAQKKALPKQR